MNGKENDLQVYRNEELQNQPTWEEYLWYIENFNYSQILYLVEE